MIVRWKWIEILFGLVWCIGFSVGRDWTVDANGYGDFTAVQDAMAVVQPGDHVWIRAGIYPEMVTILVSGTEDAPITLEGEEGGSVIIDAAGLREACIVMQNAAHLTLRRLVLQNATVAAFYAEGPVDHLSLENVECRQTVNSERAVGYGMYFYALNHAIEHITIEGCHVHHNSSHGIFLYGRNLDFIIQDNEVSHSGLESGDWEHNIKTVVWNEHGAENGPRHIQILNNDLHHAWTQGIMTWNAEDVIIRDNHCHFNGATGIQIEDGTRRFWVEGNLCEWNQQHYSTETGIWVDDAEDGVVQWNILRHNQVGMKISKSHQIIARRNLIYANARENREHQHNGGIFLLAYDDIDNDDIMVVHNTLWSIGHPAYENLGFALVEYPDFDTGSNHGAVFQNNILAQVHNGYEWVVYAHASLLSDANLYQPQDQFHASWYGTLMNFPKFQQTTSLESHGKLADPGFANPEEGDFHPRSTSAALEMGQPLATLVQILNPRVIRVDDARGFSDGMDLALGDRIRIGQGPPVRIIEIDRCVHVLVLDQDVYAREGDPVSYVFSGSAPDVGVYEDALVRGGVQLWVPHFNHTQGDWETTVHLANPHATPLQVRCTAFAPDGRPTQSETLSLPASTEQTGALDTLFPLAAAVHRGYLLLEVDARDFRMDFGLRFVPSDAVVHIPASGPASANWILPEVHQTEDLKCGVALTNPGDVEVTAIWSVRNEQGDLLAGAQTVTPAHQRHVTMLESLLGNRIPESFSLRIQTDQPVLMMALAFTPENEHITWVQGFPTD